MHINELITPDRIACKLDIGSKNAALEFISQLLAGNSPTPGTQHIFAEMAARENLGSTGFGQGIAIPHCRIGESGNNLIALITLQQGIPFNALDNKPVDLILAILTAKNCPEGHLSVLASVAQMLNDHQLCDHLRQAKTNQQLYGLITRWETKITSACHHGT